MKKISLPLFIMATAVLTISSCSDSDHETKPAANSPITGSSQAPISDEELTKSLVGSRWKIEENNNNSYSTFDFVLDPAGILRNLKSADKTEMDDSWKVSGSKVIFSVNNGKAVYTSDVAGADPQALFGTAQNFRNESWTWRAVKRKEVLFIVK